MDLGLAPLANPQRIDAFEERFLALERRTSCREPDARSLALDDDARRSKLLARLSGAQRQGRRHAPGAAPRPR